MIRSRSKLPIGWVCGVLVLAVAGCKNSDEACAIRSGEPLITVASVQDSVSHAQIADVTLSEILFNNAPVANFEFLVNPDRGPTSQVTVDAQSLRCKVACGFASATGTYRFVLGAPGYRSRIVVLDARYAQVSSGCPALLKGGMVVNESLAKS
ncbi:MAG: hypothetical protein ABIT38_05140 [Gemmatimonadaceae bacterium]